jgi:hypothetical protein
MITFRQLRNFWIACVTMIVLACFSDAVAQVSYKITDLGTNHSNDNFSMAMGLNNQGWTENMDGFVNPPENNLFTTVARGRAVINRDGRNIDLGTLGKPDSGNSWINWGGINDRGKPSVCLKHLFRIRTVKTFAASAHSLRAFRFFGEMAT